MNGNSAIMAKNLSKKYGKIQALKDLKIDIKKGEIYGLLGPNGAGKTTTVRILNCIIKPSSGVAKVLGYDILKETTEFNELRTKWVAVNKIEEDENYIYIFLTSVSAHVIPKKYFDTKSDIVKFVQEVQHHIDKNKV
ncbi:MAG: YcxB family protein [Candidatus Lokiarchaeota archaeon]